MKKPGFLSVIITVLMLIALTSCGNKRTGDITSPPGTPVITITAEPEDAFMQEGGERPSLSVGATVSAGGVLTYQWYKNTTESNSGGVSLGLLNNARTATYTVPHDLTKAGSPYYYYCVVSAQDAAPQTTRAAVVTVVGPDDKFVSVGAQSGIKYTGDIYYTEFPVTTFNLINPSFTPTIDNLPAGVSVWHFTKSEGILRLELGETAVPGEYTGLTLTLTDYLSIDVTSEPFTLTITFPVLSIVVNQTKTNTLIGENAVFTADVGPMATNKTVTWSSSNTAVAEVYASGDASCVAYGTGLGYAYIRATANDGSGFYDEKRIDISAPLSAGGSGTLDNPHIINSPALLCMVGSGINGFTQSAYYFQNAEIDMEGWTRKPRDFTGQYEGFTSTIKNYSYTVPTGAGSQSYAGLFQAVGSTGVVKNLRMQNVSINGLYETGAIAGTNNGTIQNCYVESGSITGGVKSGAVGGIVGWNQRNVEQCYTACTVNGGYWVGGVVGQNGNGYNLSTMVVKNCFATGNVTGTSGSVGGVVGYNNVGTVQNCYASGDISAGGMYAGGVVGDNTGTIEYCYATGSVKGSNRAGGVVGSNDSILRNCVGLNDKVVIDASTGTYVGRVIGFYSGGSSTNTNNYGRDTTILQYNGGNKTPHVGLSYEDGATVIPANYNGANSGAWWGNTTEGGGPAFSSGWSRAADRLPYLSGFTGVTQNPAVK